jgi:hypothetical protein
MMIFFLGMILGALVLYFIQLIVECCKNYVPYATFKKMNADMKKILILLTLAICLMPVSGWTANYFACQTGQAIGGNSTWCAYADLESGSPAACTKAAAGSYTAGATAVAAGNNLYANGCAEIITDDGFNIGTGKISTLDAGTGANDFAGGAFTFTTANDGDKTITANIEAGSSDCMTIDGSGTGTVLGIVGDVTGSSTADSARGVTDATTAGTITVTGDISAGAGRLSSHAWGKTGAGGTLIVNGNVTGGTGASNSGGIYTSGYFTALTINGDVTGGTSTAYMAPGILGQSYDAASYPCTITGNIINRNASAVYGAFIWAPSSAQKYIQFLTTGGVNTLSAGAGIGSDAGGTQVSGADTAAEIATGKYFIKKDDAVYTQGTKAAGSSGGAWGF